MRLQDTPPDDGGVLSELIRLFEKEPEVLIATTIAVALGTTVLLIGTVWAITRAGRFQPPRVVLSVIAGLVAMLAVIAVIVRPEVEALGVAVGTAIGGIVGALATAYSERNVVEDDRIIRTDLVDEQSGRSEDDDDPEA